MGRPEPCVLFAQTFVHPHLDEYVDEVIFAEPIVITACEFLEQNASSTAQAVTLAGATSPPSFALEVFVQYEGATRFSRLCQPFLYSHSSSNVLEVEAVVTNHLVVRGSYRSLSLVIYGNTAEALGQFNIEFNDGSLTNFVTSSEGKLEDLPLSLHSFSRSIEESISSLNVLSKPHPILDMSIEVKQFLQIVLKILGLSKREDTIHTAVSTIASAVSSYIAHDISFVTINHKHFTWDKFEDFEKLHCVIDESGKVLLELLEGQSETDNMSVKALAECSSMDTEANLVTSSQLVDTLSEYFNFSKESSNSDKLSQDKNVILGLSLALFLCSGRESCFHFVNGGGMEQLAHVFTRKKNSTAIILLLLGVIEQATRHAFGCEGFLGWWPREDDNIPTGISEGYSQLLKLLLQKPRHDVASLATYVLERLRFYEVASRYECGVMSVLGGLSDIGNIKSLNLNMLISANSEVKKILKIINSRGPIQDPSQSSRASRSFIHSETEGLLSYKATSGLISLSKSCFINRDIDSHLLELLKERGFLPLSAALLSSSMLFSEEGSVMDVFADVVSSIQAVVLSLLSCHSGLIFLLHQPQLSATLIHALKGARMNKDECVPLRYSFSLMSKGFFCDLREVGLIVEIHLRVVNAIDRLLSSTPNSEEFLRVLWELCGLSRSDCGRQALLIVGYFPEAVSILIESLNSVKEPGLIAEHTGATPLNLAIFHSAAEIFEVLVSDSTATSLVSWIRQATELHKALYSSSPGSNRKDAPTRLLEWIDAGVVYHRNGAIGLLWYAAVLASGGDGHLTSTNNLVSDLTAVENIVGDSSSSEINVMENLGKCVSEKSFDGVTLRDSSVTQLTTAFRILAFISENPTIAAALYDEGAVTVIYAVLVNCRFMLERSSNNYDYLIDEGKDSNSTADLLLERNREQSLIDLLIPSLVLLVTVLQKLQESKVQYRNTKLVNALLQLHREVSLKLAASSEDLSTSYPRFALGFEVICHLVVSAVACWPVYGWTPGLFHSLLANVQATSLLSLGPKETCSLLCLLNDLCPEEGIWLWKHGMPLLSATRTLAVGTLLGPQKERWVNWYLEPRHLEKLLSQLTPQLDKIAQIIKHYAVSALVVIQDMLRVLIIRIACQNPDSASILLQPMLLWIHDCITELTTPSDVDAYMIYKYLDFLAGLLEHPRGKALLLNEGLVQILMKVLDRCFDVSDLDGKQMAGTRNLATSGYTLISWCLPVFKSFSLLCSTSLQYPGDKNENLSSEDCSLILHYLLKFSQVLPVGKELLACLTAFKEIGSCNEGRSALVAIFSQIHYNGQNVETEREQESDGNFLKHSPLLECWKKLLRSIDLKDDLSHATEAVETLSSGCLCFCMNGKILNLKSVVALKYLYGLSENTGDKIEGSPEVNSSHIQELASPLSSEKNDDHHSVISDMKSPFFLDSEPVKSLLLLLQKPAGSVELNDLIFSEAVPLSSDVFSLKMNQMDDGTAENTDNYPYLEGLGSLGDKFLWECPETLPDRLSQASLPLKRKVSSLEAQSRHGRGENSQAEIMAQNVYSRGLGPSAAPSGPTRRDTFRQRKPNTSRPPSMHVDDYVARERNVDGVSNSNVIAVRRVGSAGGRPPSVHVDEFMARQRERQNHSVTLPGEPAPHVKNEALVVDTDMEKSGKSKLSRPDLDDDLHGIDIVFDGEEFEPDDKLPFPHTDDNLSQPASVTLEQNSPHSVVEETESDVNGSSHFAQDNYVVQSDEMKNDTAVEFGSSATAMSSGFSAKLPVDYRTNPQNLYPKSSPHVFNAPVATGSQGPYDQRVLMSQPPLPSLPPPTSMPVISQTPDSVQGQLSHFVNSVRDAPQPPHIPFQVQSDYTSSFRNNPVFRPDSHHSGISIPSSSGSTRPLPPLPPTPPPFSSGPYNIPPLRTTQLPMYNQANVGMETPPPLPDARSGSLSASGSTSHAPPPLMPPLMFNRPPSVPPTPYGGTSGLQQLQGRNLPTVLHNLSYSQSSFQSIHSPAQLQPLQPPQIPHTPQPPQNLMPHIQASLQLDQGVIQSQLQVQQLQNLQPPQGSSMNTYYQPQQLAQQQQNAEHVQPPPQHQQGDIASQQHELGMSLQEFFKSPEAIQSLLSDRDKLCQLLEQHPKIMQMLQEKLGQL